MNFTKYRDWLIVLLALAVPFWFLRASMKDPRQAAGPDRILIQIAAPIQQASSTLARGLSDLWGEYVYLVDVKQDNTSLASQNARLKERVGELEGTEEENRRLRRLLDLKNEMEDEVVTAQVIGKNTNEFFRVIRVTLDKPSKSIAPNLPVLSPDGVVGTTQKVAGDTVDVQLVADAGSGVDVVVQRTGARGFVRGTGDEREYSCRVEFVKRTDEVDVGDVLVTSGVGLRFPKDRRVCTVSKVTKRDFGVYQTVSCTPTVDFSRLKEVLVVLARPEPIPAPTARER
ncbi:MAG: rod shape-determining protein MreC [Polyangiaceae bacterium]|nr:rod shape-determining protein MreC [Polyangiaceae bacterium]MBK8941544.1 rod shape-determining protein MreC [Polyangiaceae bacterium]